MPISQSVSQDAIGIVNVADKSDGTNGSAAPAVSIQVGGTDGTNLRAISTDSSGRIITSDSADRIFSGSLGALNAAIVANTQGCSTVTFSVTGTWSATLTVQASVDNTNYFAINALTPTGDIASTLTANGQLVVPCGGYAEVRLIATAYTSGSAAVVYDVSTGIPNTYTPRDVINPSSPTSATIGITSSTPVAFNASRRGLVLVNLSNNRISLGFGVSAVLNNGITLYPGGIFAMDQFLFTTASVNAIASVAGSVLAVQEFT